MRTLVRLVLFSGLVGSQLVSPSVARAEEAWVEVKSANFRVWSNAGDGTARHIAWQFEQVRQAITKGWPWFEPKLSRPLLVVALKDEKSMKVWAPKYWEQRGGIEPTSIAADAPDRSYIVLRSDIEAKDLALSNPYRSAFWSYAALSLRSDRAALPLWLTTGLSHVFSNSVVRGKEIRFGAPIAEFQREYTTGARLRLHQLLELDSRSPYFTSGDTRFRFDAQSWAFVQYLLFSDATGLDRLNRVIDQIVKGTPAGAALESEYGGLEALETACLRHYRKPIFTYMRLEAESDVSRKKYEVRPVAESSTVPVRAGFSLAMNRLEDAAQLLEGSRGADTAVERDEITGLLAEARQSQDAARAAYRRAADASSRNFYVYYRLAAGPALAPDADLAVAERDARRAVELNESFVPARLTLSTVLARRQLLPEALGFARSAAVLQPADPEPRVVMATILAQMQQADQARAAFDQALKLSRTDAERGRIEDARERFMPLANATNQSATPAPVADAAATLRPEAELRTTPSSAQTPDAPGPSQAPAARAGDALKPSSGRDIQPPRRVKHVSPVHPAEGAGLKGSVIVNATIGPAGKVVAAAIDRSAGVFDQPALDAVRQWEFEPTLVDGQAVTIIMQVVVNFGY